MISEHAQKSLIFDIPKIILKMPVQIKVSVIIPFKDMNDTVRRCIRCCQDLDYNNYDIILVPDEPLKEKFKNTKVIISGPVYPSEKRNLAIKTTDADICAFIDSDAYPANKDWIKNAVNFFNDKSVGTVGGPNLVPEDFSLLEKASADVIYSRFCTGCNYPIRKYKVKGTYEYREIASSNLFVRKKLLEKIGGFDPYQLTSEDSKLCFQINKLGKKVIFVPNVVVYHRRRRLFWPHTKRVFIEGRNKAFVFKEIFSFDKLFYFFPSLFVLGLIFGFILSLFSTLISWIYITVILIYLIIVLMESLKFKLSKRALYVFLGIILTHLSYGSGFIKGIFTNKYKLKKQDQLKKITEQK